MPSVELGAFIENGIRDRGALFQQQLGGREVSGIFERVDELAAGRDVWTLIASVLDIPEGAEQPQDYWGDAMRGTCLLLGMAYQLANELAVHHRNCGETLPATTRQVVLKLLEHRDEIHAAWQRALG